MALVIPDLKEDITFRGVSLNLLTTSLQNNGRSVMVGNRVDSVDVSPPQIVQFTEKLALTDGMDYGPVYLGSRLITIQGVSLDKTRGEAWDRVSAIEAVSLPQSGTFGLYELAFSAITGASGTAEPQTIMVRPNGLQVPVTRDNSGGDDIGPLAIAWAITFLAMDPDIT